MCSPSPCAAESPPPAAPTAFSRRALLASSAAGLGLLLVGCTASGEAVTPRQADALAGQVRVQETLVAAYAAAAAADPALGAEVSDLATQARQQLDQLRAAAPTTGPSAAGSAPASGSAASAPPADARGWLRSQVTTAADSHAAACLDQIGARAALLGSIAAGLRGQEGRLT